MAIKPACIYCNNVKVNLLEEQYNDINNYITRYYKCPNCKRTFETFELNLSLQLKEFRCLLCGEIGLSIDGENDYCIKCKQTISDIKKSIEEKNINKKLEENKLKELNKKIFENAKKYRGNFFPTKDFDKMTHYLYSFMKLSHPKKSIKDTKLSKKELIKYFNDGSIIGFVQTKK